MKRVVNILKSILNGLTVISLALMVIFVFLNVVYRYLLNSGLTWSEEVSRYLFVWVIFLGAVIALIEKGHLGIDLLVGILPKTYQKILYLISNTVVVVTLIILSHGLLSMINLNSSIKAPATELPINLLPYAGLIASILMIIISIVQTVRFVFLNQDPPPWVKREDISVNDKGDYE